MAIDLLTAALASKLSYQDSSSSGSTSSLPSVTNADNGDVLGVVSGAWAKSALKTINSQSLLGSGNIDVSGLPAVTSTDNGKALTVVNGSWTAADIPSDAFVCTFTKPSTSSTISCDKSRTEILAAYDAGKQVYGKCNVNSLFGIGTGTGIFRLVNVDENNNRHVTFASEYYLPGDVSVADRYASLYIRGFTFGSIYAWSVAAQDTYSIPSGGIPESDLSSDVQEKLISQQSIADMWNSTTIYNFGDLVMHNGVLYESNLNDNSNEPGNESIGGWSSVPITSKYPGPPFTNYSVLMCNANGTIPYWGHCVTSLNGQTGDVHISLITDIYRDGSNLVVNWHDGTSNTVELPSPYFILHLNDRQVTAGLAQIKSLAEASPENLIKVKFIHAELCFTVATLVSRAVFNDGDMPFIQVADSLSFVLSGGNQKAASLAEAGISFQCIYGSYEWTMSFTFDGVVFITCIYHNNYTLMPVGDEHTVSEVCTEIRQSVQAMNYDTLQANMDSDNEFQVPMYTAGWDSLDGNTEFTMVRRDDNVAGNIMWAGVTYSVSISWDSDEQTFNVYDVIPSILS